MLISVISEYGTHTNQGNNENRKYLTSDLSMTISRMTRTSLGFDWFELRIHFEEPIATERKSQLMRWANGLTPSTWRHQCQWVPAWAVSYGNVVDGKDTGTLNRVWKRQRNEGLLTFGKNKKSHKKTQRISSTITQWTSFPIFALLIQTCLLILAFVWHSFWRLSYWNW